jgi:hypothetical protein
VWKQCTDNRRGAGGVRTALHGFGSNRKAVKYIGLLMFCVLGQNKFEVK